MKTNEKTKVKMKTIFLRLRALKAIGARKRNTNE